jgi:hypothetical protein
MRELPVGYCAEVEMDDGDRIGDPVTGNRARGFDLFMMRETPWLRKAPPRT